MMTSAPLVKSPYCASHSTSASGAAAAYPYSKPRQANSASRLVCVGDALRLLTLPRFGEMGSQRLLDLREALGKALRFGLGPRNVLDAFGPELLRVALPHRGRSFDALVQQWLRVGGLVALVVPVAPIAYDVDHDVGVELVAVHHGEPRRREARLGVVGVHVHDRRVEALRQ